MSTSATIALQTNFESSIVVRINGDELPNIALERIAHSLMKHTIATSIGVCDGHWDNVSLIGRLSGQRFLSASVGDA